MNFSHDKVILLINTFLTELLRKNTVNKLVNLREEGIKTGTSMIRTRGIMEQKRITLSGTADSTATTME